MRLSLFDSRPAPTHPDFSSLGFARPKHDAPTILVVDDDAALCGLYTLALRQEGYVVREAHSAADALTIAADADRIDVLVSDIRMPVMNGNDLADELRSGQPDLQVVFVTAFLTRVRYRHGVHVLEKPFAHTELIRTVHEALREPPTIE